MRCLRLVLGLSLWLVACDGESSSGGSGADGGAGGVGGAGGSGGTAGAGGDFGECQPHVSGADPDFAQTEGRFRLRAQDGFAIFEGRVLDGAPFEFHVEEEREGQCRLLGFTPSNCTPDCDFGSFCVDGACVAPGASIDAGALTLTEFLDEPVSIMESENSYYWSIEPLANANARATLSAEGSVAGEFSLSACVPTAVTPTEDWSQLMEARAAGEDVTLTWSDAAEGARISMRMTTGIGTHGGISPVEIECEGPDTGSLTLPGAYLDALFEDGWGCGECGDNHLFRYYAADAEVAAGTVRFRTESEHVFFFHP